MTKIIIEDDKEAWYKSRRVWGAILAGISFGLITFFPEQTGLISSLTIFVAGSLGIASFKYPKVK